MRYLTLLICLFSFATLQAQTDSIHLRSQTFTIEDGLSQNMVTSLFTDSRGFLWLGTKDGLNRYDGVDFVHFRHDPENPQSLPDNSIETIEEDSHGRLWIGTTDGVAVYDPKHSLFQAIPILPITSTGKNAVRSIAEDPYGNIWLGTLKGVYKVVSSGDEEFEATTELVLPFPDLQKGPFKPVIHLDITSTGFVYMGCNAGFYVTRAEEGSGKDERFRRLSEESVSVLTIDRQDRIWYCNSHLMLYKPIQGIFMEVTPIPDPPTAEITDIEIDPEGNVWFSETDALNFKPPLSRLHKYAPVTDALTVVQGLEFPAIISMAFTKDLLWAGTAGYGVKRVDLKSALFRIYDARTPLAKVYNNPNLKNVFFHKGDPTFISYQNKRLTTFDVITGAPLNTDRQVHAGIQSHIPAFYNDHFPCNAVSDELGHIWHFAFSDDEGHKQLIELDKNLKEIKRKSFGYSFIHLIYFDMQGKLWFSSGDLLLEFHRDTWTITEHPLTAPGDGAVTNTSMLSDGKGDFWLGSANGLKRYNPLSGKLTTYATGHPELRYNILSILNDPFSPEEYLWVGTEGGGLIKLHKPSGNCRRYISKDGLPNLVVYGILPDERGNLWLSTNSGLSRLDTKTDTFANFSREDGLPGNEFNRFMYGILNDGRLWFESLQGIVAFDPLRVIPDTLPPQMVFTQIKNFNKILSPNTYPDLIDKPASYAENITLPWHDNVVSFSYTALDFRAPGKNRFSTRMEGIDKDWSPPLPERTATYAHLAPGKYTFRVRASNSNGYWNKKGIAINLTILAPWWQTPLAYIIYALLIGGAIYGLYKIRINRVRLQFTLNNERLESDRLQEVDRLKNEFFSNITHEFRTPITLIINPIQRLISKNENPEERTELSRIHRNANQLLRLINQLLDLSKIDSGMMRIDLARGEVVNFVREIVDTFAPLANSKNISLTFHSSERQKETLFDPSALEKITYNLISNAIKYTKKNGKVEVDLLFRKRNRETWMTLEVSDNGPGIESSDHDRIFDRYYRSSKEHTNVGSGTGIGLALVREITGIYGGEISLQSIPGAGSTFQVDLPLEASTDSVSLISQHIDRTPVDEFEDDALPETISESDDRPVVLVVEDNDDLRNFIHTCLAPQYSVIEASNGQEAIDISTQSIPDAVISDVMMPVMDGMEFLELLKTDERTSHIPIILLTAKTNRRDREAALGKGADAFLTKPFYETELLALLNNLLQLRTQTWNLYRSRIIKIHQEGQTTAEEAFVQKLRHYIEANIADQNIAVDHLCRAAAMSRTQLHRKLKAITGHPTGTFIRLVRLEKARELIEIQDANISEVAFQTGFNTHSYFSKCFAEAYGMSPTDYQKQFRR